MQNPHCLFLYQYVIRVGDILCESPKKLLRGFHVMLWVELALTGLLRPWLIYCRLPHEMTVCRRASPVEYNCR